MKFENRYRIGAREIDKANKITNYGILAFLEDIASLHSDSLGYGVKDIDVKKRAWLLMDWNLNVKHRPGFGEEVKVITWAVSLEKSTFYTYRAFEVYDINDELIAKAITKWVFFDLEKKKITKIENEVISLYNPEAVSQEEIDKIDKLKEQENISSVYLYQTKRSDIDMNNHMHNLNYLNLAYEALPKEVYEKFYEDGELNNVRIMYKHQIRPEEKVKCFYSHDGCNHFVAIKSEDEKVLHSIIKLW